MYTHAQYDKLVKATVEQIYKLSKLKGGEYAGDHDRLANFRRNALEAELPMETIWRVYTAKHWDAIMQYEKDIRQGKTRQRAEGIAGRLDDLIVYAILFKAMVEEREAGPQAPGTPAPAVRAPRAPRKPKDAPPPHAGDDEGSSGSGVNPADFE